MLFIAAPNYFFSTLTSFFEVCKRDYWLVKLRKFSFYMFQNNI